MYHRSYNTDKTGKTFDESTIQQVWEKAFIVNGYNPTYVRADSCGALIERKQYGNTNSSYGWEVDHIIPVSAGGVDLLYNLQPLQWKNNRAKSDGPLVCEVR